MEPQDTSNSEKTLARHAGESRASSMNSQCSGRHRIAKVNPPSQRSARRTELVHGKKVNLMQRNTEHRRNDVMW